MVIVIYNDFAIDDLQKLLLNHVLNVSYHRRTTCVDEGSKIVISGSLMARHVVEQRLNCPEAQHPHPEHEFSFKLALLPIFFLQMETVNAMDILAATALSNTNAEMTGNEAAMRHLSLEPDTVPTEQTGSASPVQSDHESVGDDADEGEDEKEDEEEVVVLDEPASRAAHREPKSKKKKPATPIAHVPAAVNGNLDAEIEKPQDNHMDEDTRMSPKSITAALDPIPPSEPVHIPMDEDEPAVEPTDGERSPSTKTPEPAGSSTENPASEESTSSPKPATPVQIPVPMDEDAPAIESTDGGKPPSTESAEQASKSTEKSTSDEIIIIPKPAAPARVLPNVPGWGPVDDDSTPKVSDGWGAASINTKEADDNRTTEDAPTNTAVSTTTQNGGWGPSTSSDQSATTTINNPWLSQATSSPAETSPFKKGWGDSNDWGGGGSGDNADSGTRGFGRGGSRGRGSWGGDGPRNGPRPSSFNGGFGPSSDGDRRPGHGRFLSGSNTEPLLPALGRGRASAMRGGMRKVGYEPYPAGGRRPPRSVDDSSSGGLEYADDGRFDDTIVQAPVAMIGSPVKLVEATKFSNLMSGPDIAELKTALLKHLKNLLKHQESRLETLHTMKKREHHYLEEAHNIDKAIKAETDFNAKLKLMESRNRLRSAGVHDEHILKASMKLADAAIQKEIETLMQTIGEALADKLQESILDIVRTVSTGNGAGPPQDISAVIERCLMTIAPNLLKDKAQGRAQRQLEQRQTELEEMLKSKDATILEMKERLRRIEERLDPKPPTTVDSNSVSSDNATATEADTPKSSRFWFF